MTVRKEMNGPFVDEVTREEYYTVGSRDPILDARIIRGTCPTCGGLRQVPSEELDGHVAMQVSEPCPDCADAPVTVIEPAAMEAFVCVRSWPGFKDIRSKSAARDWHNRIAEADHFDALWADAESHALPLLQALLPGARVAEEIRVVFDGPPGAVSGRFVEVETPDGASVNAGTWHERGDGLWELRISAAILATQAREEVEE